MKKTTVFCVATLGRNLGLNTNVINFLDDIESSTEFLDGHCRRQPDFPVKVLCMHQTELYMYFRSAALSTRTIPPPTFDALRTA
eukprot:2292883-Ditylum_brightwellii.AAC.1